MYMYMYVYAVHVVVYTYTLTLTYGIHTMKLGGRKHNARLCYSSFDSIHYSLHNAFLKLNQLLPTHYAGRILCGCW